MNYKFKELKRKFQNKTSKKKFSRINSTLLIKCQNSYLIEKRKRLQAYKTIDYYLSYISYSDFFTKDVLKIFYNSKAIAYLLGTNFLTSDMLIYSFFINNLGFSKLLKKANLTKKRVEIDLWNNWQKPIKLRERIMHYYIYIYIYINLFYSFKKIKTYPYSKELKKVIKKIYEKSCYKYCTPIISSDILFIALIEEKKSFSRQMINRLITNKNALLYIRYKILLRIYNMEVNIYQNLPSGFIFFNYLLKSKLKAFHYVNLIFDPFLNFYATLRFRNNIIINSLNFSYINILKKELINKMLIKINRTNKIK